MTDWEIIDHATVPDDDGTIFLASKEGAYAIYINGRLLMGEGEHGSEEALADLACDRLVSAEGARILVGGLGLGFTLAAALRRVGPTGSVTVAELMPAVVRWNRGVLGRAAGHPLNDPRAVVHAGDVAAVVRTPPHLWSAILLDVDNGPKALTHYANGWLYSKQGLTALKKALLPGGVLGVWSATGDANFTRRLCKAGFDVEMVRCTEHGVLTDETEATHVLWLARRRVLVRPAAADPTSPRGSLPAT